MTVRYPEAQKSKADVSAYGSHIEFDEVAARAFVTVVTVIRCIGSF